MKTGDKTQPQELLESILPDPPLDEMRHGDPDENEKYPSDPEPIVPPDEGVGTFPSIAEQQKYWDEKEKAGEPKPEFTCPVCLKQFKSPQGVLMHKARVHDKTIVVPRRKKPKEKVDRDAWRKEQAVHPLYDYPPTAKQLSETHTRPISTAELLTGIRPPRSRKWSLARRRAYNAKVKAKAACAEYDKAKGWLPVPPPPQEEPVTMIRFCPCCGRNIERWLS